MRRPAVSRALAALFAVWFTAYAVEPAALHACDVHDAPHAANTSAAATHADDVHTSHSASRDDAQHSDETSCCTCPGDCAASSPAALATTTALVAVVTTATTDSGLSRHEYVPVAAQHVLPFANGPPTRV